MARRKKYRFSIEGEPLYPHIKLTRERFPRLLATRIIADDDAEYFGAFLHRSAARILIDFLNTTFRLRSCEMDLDGSWNYPCTMYYKRRCLAPCVSDLATDPEYSDRVSIVRKFLLNVRTEVVGALEQRIQAASERQEFEAAARWSEMLTSIRNYWNDARIAPWTDTISDTFEVRRSKTGVDIFLLSQRSRRVLGERAFTFQIDDHNDVGVALAEVIEQFYRFHAPKEIRVSDDFERRLSVQRSLSERFGRRIPILVLSPRIRKVSTEVGIFRSTTELEFKRSVRTATPRMLLAELKTVFRLTRRPEGISAIDVSHLAGTDKVAAAIGWSNGRTDPGSAEYLLAPEVSEPGALAELVAKRYAVGSSRELVLIDGGKAQLNAAIGALPVDSKNVLIAAVKPHGRHTEISHFLLSDGSSIDFDPSLPSMRLLQDLRDRVHEYALAVHRDTRDYAEHYEMVNIAPALTESQRQFLLRRLGSRARVASADTNTIEELVGHTSAKLFERDRRKYIAGARPRILPLVVPIRFQDENGMAEDLRPIEKTSGKFPRFR